MTNSALNKILAFEADEIADSALEKLSQSLAEGQVHGSPKPSPGLTLDERSNLYLKAVYRSRDFTSEDYAKARKILLEAMADNFRTQSNAPDLEGSNSPVKAGMDQELIGEVQDWCGIPMIGRWLSKISRQPQGFKPSIEDRSR